MSILSEIIVARSKSRLFPAVACFWFCLNGTSCSADLADAAPFGGKKGKPSTEATKTPDAASKPNQLPGIQPEFQKEFARQMAATSAQGEGWALFSNSGMGHNGQHWLIKDGDQIKTCLIKQMDQTCTIKTLGITDFTKAKTTFVKADQLKDIPAVGFDGITFEYLHVKNSSPMTVRVKFVTGAKPFPDDYENLVKAFNF